MYSPLRTPSVLTSVNVPSGESIRKCSFTGRSSYSVNDARGLNVSGATAPTTARRPVVALGRRVPSWRRLTAIA
jgi:hypothetical protein